MKKLPLEDLCAAAGRAITMDDLRETIRQIRRQRFVTPYQARCNAFTAALLDQQFVPNRLRDIKHVIWMTRMPVELDDSIPDGEVRFDYPTMPEELEERGQ